MARNAGRFFRNAINAMVEARAKQVDRYVNGALLMLDDATLTANGFDRAELKRKSSATYLF